MNKLINIIKDTLIIRERKNPTICMECYYYSVAEPGCTNRIELVGEKVFSPIKGWYYKTKVYYPTPLDDNWFGRCKYFQSIVDKK